MKRPLFLLTDREAQELRVHGECVARRPINAATGEFGASDPVFTKYDFTRAWIDPGVGGGEYLKVPFCYFDDLWESDPDDDTVDRLRFLFDIGTEVRTGRRRLVARLEHCEAFVMSKKRGEFIWCLSFRRVEEKQ